MKKDLSALIVVAGLTTTLVLSSCTQMPTEKQSITDVRPQISFKVDGERPHRAYHARVLLDGLDMGPVSDYMDGATSVRILPGTHTLRVVSGDEVLIDEKFYVGDGVSRTFILK
jgi:hypothetical protein